MSILRVASHSRHTFTATRKKQGRIAPPFGLVIAVGLTTTLGDLPVVQMPTSPTAPLILPVLDEPSSTRHYDGLYPAKLLRAGWSQAELWRASIDDNRQPTATLALFNDRPAPVARRRTKRGRLASVPHRIGGTPRSRIWRFAFDDIAPLGIEHDVLASDTTSPEQTRLTIDSRLTPRALSETGENRRVAPLGIAADTMRFDDRPGCLSTAAETARWNGQPAAVMGFGYTLPDRRARLTATGVARVMPGPRTFGVSAVASIALD